MVGKDKQMTGWECGMRCMDNGEAQDSLASLTDFDVSEKEGERRQARKDIGQRRDRTQIHGKGKV